MLRNLILAWAPFDDADHFIVTQAGSAMVWAWDRGLVAALLVGAAAPTDARCVPEALLAAPPSEDAMRLVQVLEGVEGQHWRKGALRSSRWWPDTPEPGEWARWVRSADADLPTGAGDVLPAVQATAWRQPWADGVGLDALMSSTSRLEQVALGAALAGLVGLSSAQLHQGWTAYAEHRDLVVERDRLAAQVAPVLSARDRALVLSGTADVIARQLSAPAPLEVLEHMAQRLPAPGAVLKEFELTGQRLRIALEVAPDLARTALVGALQASGWFVQVNEVRDVSGRGWVGFDMQIQGVRPPATDGGASPPRAAVAPTAGPAFPGQPGVTAFPLPTTRPAAGPTEVRR